MKYNITIDHHNKIIRYKQEGIIELAQIGEAMKKIIQLEEYKVDKYNIFCDYRNSRFNFSVKEFEIIIIFLTQIKDLLYGRKNCILTDSPYNTAISILLESELMNNLSYSIKVFSTEEAALEWISF